MLYYAKVMKYNPVIKTNRWLSEIVSPPQKKGRPVMKKIFALVLTLIVILSVFAGCGQQNTSDLAYVQEKGKLVVGVTIYEPMDYQDENGNWTGFDAEFAQMVAEDLGVEAEFVIIADWKKKFVELQMKEIDVVWNGMTITDEAKANASVSDPYVINAQVVVTKADVAANFATTDSLKDISIAVENGSAAAQALDAIGITDYLVTDDQAKALTEVLSGTSDACVIDITMARAMIKEGSDFASLAIAQELTSEYYGIAFRKDSDITAKVNELMAGYMADGTLAALAQKYNVALVED